MTDHQEQNPAPPPARRRRRPLWRMVARDVLPVPLLLAGALALAWEYRAPLVETAAPLALARAGLGPADVTVESVTADTAVLTRVSLAGGQASAARIRLTFSVAGLDRVEIAGLETAAAWDPATGLDIGPFNRFLDGGGTGTVPTVPFNTLVLTDVRLTLNTPEGPVRVLGDATLRADAEGGAALTADLTAAGAGLFAAANVEAWPWPDPEARALLALQAEARDRPGLAAGLAGGGLLDVAWAGGAVSVSSDAVRVRADGLDPALLDGLPPAVAALADGPLSVTLEGRAGAPARLTVPLDGGAPPRLTGRIALETARLSLTVGAADLALDGPPAPESLSATLTDVTLAGRSLDPLVPVLAEGLGGTLTSPRLVVERGALSGPVALTADSGAVSAGAGRAEAVRLEAAGHVEASAAGGTATLSDATLGLTAPVWPGAWEGGGDLSLALAEGRAHTLALDLTAPDGPALTVDAALAPFTLDGPVGVDVASVAVTGRAPWTAAAPLSVALAVPSAQGDGWTADDITADLTLRPEGPTLTAAAALPRLPGETAGAIPAGHPLRPLRLRGTLAPDPGDPARLSVEAAAGAPLRATLLTARGWIGRDGRDGRLRFDTPRPLGLGTDGVQPWHLHGRLKDLSASAGTVAVEGSVTWAKGGRPRPDLSVGLADVDAAFGATGLTKLNGVVRLTGLAPLRSPSQELVAAGLRMGLPFSDLSVRYRLDGGGSFVLEEARMHFAGGEIVSDSATIPLAGFERIPLTLTVTGLDLGQLAAMTPIDDLAVTGTVDGQVPMVILPGEVRIDAGRLGAQGAGALRYTGSALPDAAGAGQGVDLARRALEDFQYTGLSMDVDGSTRDDFRVGLHLSGSNPQVLDGYPFELNLTLSGPLTKIIRDSIASYTIPDRIREKLLDMGLK